MAWTDIAKRAVGACIPKTWLDTFIDNLTFLYNAIGGSGTGTSGALQNGSFENDTDADGIPDGWTRTLYTGGSFAIETTSPTHGARAIKFTSPGGAGNGGGYIDNDDYLLCSDIRPVVLRWTMWGTADVNNLVDLLFYDKAKGYLSTVNLYTEAAANPTSETQFHATGTPPANARYFKIRLTGCKNDDATAGSTYFDDVAIGTDISTVVGYAEAATGNTTVDHIDIEGTTASSTSGIGSISLSVAGAKTGVVGGTNVAVAVHDGTNTATVTVTLALPEGTWTIYATGTSFYNDPTGWSTITAMAIRQET